MELRHLRYFVAVAREGSVTRAAARLHIQQPPLSQQIRDLEAQVGYRLLERLPRGVRLTAGGAVFLEEAEAILARVEAAVRRGNLAAHGTAGTLSVGFTSSALTHRLAPALLRRYREAHPGVELTVHEGNAATLTESVAGGHHDCAFIRQPVSEHGGVAFDTLAVEPLLLILPMAHPAAEKARRAGHDRVRLRDLAAEAFILVRRPGAPGMYGNLIEACRAAGFAPRVVAEVSQMLTNVTLVAAGFGVSVVPASMQGIHADAVFYARARDAPGLVAPLTLVTPSASGNPVIARFLAFAREFAAGEAPPGQRARKPASAPARARARSSR